MDDELKKYLQEILAPTFLSLIPDGIVYYNLNRSKKYINEERTTVQISRYLWFYSAYYQKFKDEKVLKSCHQLYGHLIDRYKTKEQGYVVSNSSDNYHVYSQSFVLYGLSEYYKINNSQDVLEEMESLHRFIEKYFYKSEINMYQEQIDASLEDTDRNIIDARLGGYTANSLIHLLEAYTNVVNATGSHKETLIRLLDILFNKFYNSNGYFIPYITKEGAKDDSYISYGHDIETIWLVIETLKALNIKVEDYAGRLIKVYKTVVEKGLRSDGYIKVQSNKEISCWWAQVEAIVGFAYCKEYLGIKNKFSEIVYQFTKAHYMTEQGLLNEIDNEGNVINDVIANSWKTPYHDGRMMLKMLDYFEKEHEERL